MSRSANSAFIRIYPFIQSEKKTHLFRWPWRLPPTIGLEATLLTHDRPWSHVKLWVRWVSPMDVAHLTESCCNHSRINDLLPGTTSYSWLLMKQKQQSTNLNWWQGTLCPTNLRFESGSLEENLSFEQEILSSSG